MGTLLEARSSSDPAEVLNALEVAASLGIDLGTEVKPLLAHALAEVRRAACLHAARHPSAALTDPIRALTDDPSAEVASAALTAFAAIAPPDVSTVFEAKLKSPDGAVRVAAAVAWHRSGALQGREAVQRWLEGAQTAALPHLRQDAAQVIGEIGAPAFAPLLRPLLLDEVMSVRRHAIAAAGRTRSRELLGPLLHQLSRSDVARDAADAISELGSGCEEALSEAVGDPNEPQPVTSSSSSWRTLTRRSPPSKASAVIRCRTAE